MKCPFMKNSNNVPRECKKDCALYYQEHNQAGDKVENMQGCSFYMMAQYLDEVRYHLCHGVEVYSHD